MGRLPDRRQAMTRPTLASVASRAPVARRASYGKDTQTSSRSLVGLLSEGRVSFAPLKPVSSADLYPTL